jgi:predicted kinase
MQNTCVYILGPPGVGKFTVAKSLSVMMPARVVDNHYWNNPIFEIVEPDGLTPLPDAVWSLAGTVRQAVLEAVATLAPAGRNFIFTHAISHDGGHEGDRRIADQILAAAGRRGAATLLVRLSCAPSELAARIVAPDRSERLKQRDASRAEAYCALAPFDPGHPWAIHIDTTALTARETADLIAEELRGALAKPRSASKPGD